MYRNVKYVLIEQCYQVVVVAHQTTSNIHCVQSLSAIMVKQLSDFWGKIRSCGKILISQRHDAHNHLLPLYGLDISIRNIEEIVVEVVHAA